MKPAIVLVYGEMAVPCARSLAKHAGGIAVAASAIIASGNNGFEPLLPVFIVDDVQQGAFRFWIKRCAAVIGAYPRGARVAKGCFNGLGRGQPIDWRVAA